MARKKTESKLTGAAKTLGAAGGKVGGPARAKALPSQRRKDIAAMGGAASKGKKKTGR